MAKNPFENFYTDLLADQPQMAYQAAIPFTGQEFSSRTRPQERQRDYWSNQYSNIYNQYLGQQGQGIGQLAAGGTPVPQSMQSFSEYLKGVPFAERYGALTPQQKGTTTSRFAPATRHIYF